MASRKILIYATIVCVILISSVLVYLIYFAKSNIHSDSMIIDTKYVKKTNLSTEISPQMVYGTLDNLSLKGYLTKSDNTGISNKNVQIILKKIRIDDNQTIEKNMIVGNSTTDQNGCFYFNGWNNDIINNALDKIPKPFPPTSVLSFKINFTGTDEFSQSSNTTEVGYSPVVPSGIRPAIGLNLGNSTGLVQDIDLKRGKSYDFELMVFNGGYLFSPEEKILKLNIKGLPCGVTGTFENDMANFTAQDHVITHLKVSVDEKTKPGQYYYFIIGNNWTLREAKLIIE